MKKFVILAALTALAACNSGTQDGQEITVEGEGADSTVSINSGDGEMNIQSGANAKVALPLGFTAYPGAKVISNVNADFGDGMQNTVAMNTPDSLAKVTAFYKQQATAAGVKIATEMTTPESVLLGGETASGAVFGLIAGPAETGGTTVNLSLQVKGK